MQLESEFLHLQSFIANVAKLSKNKTTLLAEVRDLHGELTEYVTEMEAVLDLVPQERKPRSLCDGFGRLVSSLTGLMDDEDRTTVQGSLGDLQGRVDELEAEITPHKAIIQGMLNGTMQNAKILNALTREMVTNGNAIGDLRSAVDLEAKLREISFWVAKLRFERSQLRLGLEGALEGTLRGELFPPQYLFNVLRRIEGGLAEQYRLVTEVTAKKLKVFYDLGKVILSKIREELVITIDFPLRRVGMEFALWKLIAIPVFHPALQSFVQLDVKDYLIMSSDFKWFAALSSQTVDECKKSVNITVCPAKVPLSMETVNACEFELFSSKKSSNCEKRILSNKPDGYFLRLGNKWVFSVINSTKLSINCGQRHEFRVVTGAGVLRGLQHCDIGTTKQLMFGGVELTSEMVGEWEDSVIPTIDGVAGLTVNEEQALEEEKERGDLAENVRQFAAQSADRAMLSALLSTLSERRRSRPWVSPQIH